MEFSGFILKVLFIIVFFRFTFWMYSKDKKNDFDSLYGFQNVLLIIMAVAYILLSIGGVYILSVFIFDVLLMAETRLNSSVWYKQILILMGIISLIFVSRLYYKHHYGNKKTNK